ncbi:MAG: phosphomannose isomerase type II C-terminal cupin domain [Candidatus Magasanikiibacteriota bacterium]
METEQRPWGQYKVLLDTPTCKVKEILVKPEHRLSYQMHYKRSEHWFVVSGVALVTLNDRDIVVKKGEYVDIPVESKHRVANQGNEDLVFIEIQTGEYFGEDDIVRFEDDYDRH